jgi:hypothetical protein
MSTTSPHRLGDKVTLGKNKTVVSVSGIAMRRDASSVDYAMVSMSVAWVYDKITRTITEVDSIRASTYSCGIEVSKSPANQNSGHSRR